MTQTGHVYGEALYRLCREDSLADIVLPQLLCLRKIFAAEPDFPRLLSSPALSKTERCHMLDHSFRQKLHPYVVNFLKILTENGDILHFNHCCQAFTDQYNLDNGILPVSATTALPLTSDQAVRLISKLENLTDKTIELTNQVDPAILGGIRLDYGGKRLDDTLSHRLDAIGSLLKNTVL